MHIKANIVAYAFLVQCFENATIVAYVGLRVKVKVCLFHYSIILLFCISHFVVSHFNITVMCVQCTGTYSGDRLVCLDNFLVL